MAQRLLCDLGKLARAARLTKSYSQSAKRKNLKPVFGGAYPQTAQKAPFSSRPGRRSRPPTKVAPSNSIRAGIRFESHSLNRGNFKNPSFRSKHACFRTSYAYETAGTDAQRNALTSVTH